MLKQGLIYLVLSLIVVLFSNYVGLIIIYIKTFYIYLNVVLTPFFQGLQAGAVIRSTLLLLGVPILITGVPALFYRLIKKKDMPYCIEITWLIWLIIVLSHFLIR
ncbi:MAG: hypothetical protein ACOYKA_00920 [Legionellaceae bacterium]